MPFLSDDTRREFDFGTLASIYQSPIYRDHYGDKQFANMLAADKQEAEGVDDTIRGKKIQDLERRQAELELTIGGDKHVELLNKELNQKRHSDEERLNELGGAGPAADAT